MKLNAAMRDLLIEHIDGDCVQVVLREVARMNLVKGAERLGFLRFDRKPRPRKSWLTEKGRAILAKALADWADALVRAQSLRADALAALEYKPGKVAETKHFDKIAA